MKTEQEIRELKDYLVTDYHSNRVTQQTIDEQYYNDLFSVGGLVKNTDYITRTGRARRMVDKPVEHVVTSNPQVFRDTGRKDADDKVAKELNRWDSKLSRYNPNPFEQHPRFLFLRGEGWHYIVHNDLPAGWQKTHPEAMPIKIMVLDPLVVFGDPLSGEDDGIPGAVIISYERTVSSLIQRYPLSWKSNKPGKNKVPFFMYMDKDVRYIEADGYPATEEGMEKNIYGFVPFVHSYSGLGGETAEGDPASLAYGVLRPNRDLLRAECVIESNIAYIIDKYSYRNLNIRLPMGITISDEQIKNYNASGGQVNVFNIPPEGDIKTDEDLAPSQEVFVYRASVKAELDLQDPGIPSGSTGRHEDINYRNWRKKFDRIADHSARATATALGIGLRICEKIPDWLPPSLNKADIGGKYECTVELRSSDPIEEDRLRTLGSRLAQPDARGIPQIDWETNLVKYQGFTTGEAQDIMAKAMADMVMLLPDTIQILAMRYMQERGMEEYMAALKERQALQQSQGGIGSQGGEPREGNIQTAQGREEADLSLMNRGQRRSPQ